MDGNYGEPKEICTMQYNDTTEFLIKLKYIYTDTYMYLYIHIYVYMFIHICHIYKLLFLCSKNTLLLSTKCVNASYTDINQ